MIREVIVTSSNGVRLAFESSGEQGLVARRGSWESLMVDIRDPNKPDPDNVDGQIIGTIPTSWLIEFNENVS